jgi:hypothetical protein
LGDRWHIADGTEKTRQNLPAVAYRGKPLGLTVGILWTAQREMPTVGPTIAQSATVGKLDDKSNPPDLVNQVSHRWMWFSTEV